MTGPTRKPASRRLIVFRTIAGIDLFLGAVVVVLLVVRAFTETAPGELAKAPPPPEAPPHVREISYEPPPDTSRAAPTPTQLAHNYVTPTPALNPLPIPKPTPLPTPTATPSPIVTPLPTPTPKPIATPQPSPSPQPQPQPATTSKPQTRPMAQPVYTFTLAAPDIKNFQIKGEIWTCEYQSKPVTGTFLKPVGDGPFPAVILSHPVGVGAEFGRNRGRDFVKLGMVVITPELGHKDPKGDRALFGASAENVRREKAAYEMLLGMPFVDPKKIYAYGQGIGAGTTLALTLEIPEGLAAAAIVGGGVMPTAGTPLPSVDSVYKIKTPIIMVHGSKDSTVTPERSLLLKQMLDRNHVPNDRQVLEDGPKGSVYGQKWNDILALVEDWFNKHTAPPAADTKTKPASMPGGKGSK